MKHQLSPELTHLVNWSVTELGKVIEFEIGAAGFRRIEKIRRFVKSPSAKNVAGLLRLKKELEKLNTKERYEVAHAFALMLELINSCEAAYRTYRLKIEEHEAAKPAHLYGRVIHVLTAHPTESRSPDIIYYFKKIQNLLERRLEHPDIEDERELSSLLKWAWYVPMSKQRKPTVMDEAEYVYSLALDREIIEIYLKQRALRHPFNIRTWVGGDKDGHPGVDEKTMIGSLQMARGFLLRWLLSAQAQFIKDLEPLTHSAHQNRKKFSVLLKKAHSLRTMTIGLRHIQSGDARRVHRVKDRFDELSKIYREFFEVDSATLLKIRHFFRIFPGLVVPLELREDSSVVHEALKHPRKNLSIARMLKTLAKISPEHDPRFYVRGFVLSHTESANDIAVGLKLATMYLQKSRLPIVPLFESSHALQNSVKIVEEFLKGSARKRIVKNLWSGNFEVMLGYSDSAKENGAFPSRYLIQSALTRLEKVIANCGLHPVFFHGSGGSVERGGGSVQEQTSWWPSSALENVKVTVQGEMIYRNYAAPEILVRQLERFMDARDERAKFKTPKLSLSAQKALRDFAEFIQDHYQNTLKDPAFLRMIEEATPYSYLKDLKMGSRPAKRQGPVNLNNLRAIPWVLCWTQTRTLFPSWWGVGSYWKTLNSAQKKSLQRALRESALFSSYVKLLGFTLEKMELDVFAMYLRSSRLSPSEQTYFESIFRKEFSACKKCFFELTGESNLLWYRPWLRTSVHLRSPLIHPLNVLQLIALKEKELLLLRETVTGVASGMLTTG